MRKGGGKNKGSQWERAVATFLSLWVSEGARADLFARSVGSGSRFTTAKQRAAETAQPGDLVSSHELAFPFLRVFMVECKHKFNIDMMTFLCGDLSSKNFIATTIRKAQEEARHAKLHWMIAAKQNQKEPLILISGAHAAALNACARNVLYHVFHKGTGDSKPGVLCIKLDDLTTRVSCKKFLAAIEKQT